MELFVRRYWRTNVLTTNYHTTHSSTFWIILDKISIFWISVPKTRKGMAFLKLYVWQIPIVLVPTNVNITKPHLNVPDTPGSSGVFEVTLRDIWQLQWRLVVVETVPWPPPNDKTQVLRRNELHTLSHVLLEYFTVFKKFLSTDVPFLFIYFNSWCFAS